MLSRVGGASSPALASATVEVALVDLSLRQPLAASEGEPLSDENSDGYDEDDEAGQDVKAGGESASAVLHERAARSLSPGKLESSAVGLTPNVAEATRE